ncbi:hypothetical protein AC249_AIPGENE24658 [Exaiptasia diaphana]|nr:hypothetical protein AC249_AIPGENE24658 [Exaiptasia diaphana]
MEGSIATLKAERKLWQVKLVKGGENKAELEKLMMESIERMVEKEPPQVTDQCTDTTAKDGPSSKNVPKKRKGKNKAELEKLMMESIERMVEKEPPQVTDQCTDTTAKDGPSSKNVPKKRKGSEDNELDDEKKKKKMKRR